MDYAKLEIMTSKELAEFAGLPYKHLWTYQKRGILPPADFHIGNKPLWLKQSVLEWDTQRKQTDEVELSSHYQ